MKQPLPKFWRAIGTMMLAVALFLTGCGESSNPYSAIRKLYEPSPDTDVSSVPEYNFSLFTGTVWRTKTTTAITDLKRYTGAHDISLSVPEHFDPTNPEYTPPSDLHYRIVSVLPVGSRLRIEKLMHDNGAGGILLVTGTLLDETNSQGNVFLDSSLLTRNRWIGFADSTNWSVNPGMLASYQSPDDRSTLPAPSALEATDRSKAAYENGYANGKKQAAFVPRLSQAGIDYSHLFDPWLGNREWRPLAIQIHGAEYVEAYESGYRKGFRDHAGK
jgi:hypothetical protein